MPRAVPIVSPVHDLLSALGDRLLGPIAIVLGASGHVARLAARLTGDVVCYQMDLHSARQLQDDLNTFGSGARVVTAPDLWDVPADFRTVIYPAPERGERSLKLDVIEQAYHVLQPRGTFAVHTPRDADQLFPDQVKKVFGRVHHPAAGEGRVLWAQRQEDGPRRRHEISYHVRFGEGPSLVFASRPGVFSFGYFDNGARALVETMDVRPGDRVLDIGCGVGTNGIIAARLAGPNGHVAFVDSNLRAIALTELNARANGVTNFETFASATVEGPPAASFDVVLANPPYFAQQSIARLFIERGRQALKPCGRFYLVTKQPDAIGPFMAETFGATEVVERRGYVILCATAPGSTFHDRR